MLRKLYSSLFLLVLTNANAIEINQDVLEQRNGNYPEMDRREHMPLGAIQRAWDKTKGGVYEVQYESNKVIKVRLREWLNTTVVLPRWEKIEQVVIGNEEYVKDTIVKDNIVILKPQGDVGADTNISIVGKGHTYLLYVRIEGYNSKNVPDVGVNIHAFPPRGINSDSASSSDTQANDWLTNPAENINELDFKFSMSGSREIAPELVYSDGIKTWLNYGDKLSKKNLPAVFLVEDGVDTPVNNMIIKNSIVVNGHGILTLKNGGRTTCIYPTKLGRHNGKN